MTDKYLLRQLGRKILPPEVWQRDYDVLTRSEDFEGRVASTAEEDADGSEYGEDESQHDARV